MNNKQDWWEWVILITVIMITAMVFNTLRNLKTPTIPPEQRVDIFPVIKEETLVLEVERFMNVSDTQYTGLYRDIKTGEFHTVRIDKDSFYQPYDTGTLIVTITQYENREDKKEGTFKSHE